MPGFWPTANVTSTGVPYSFSINPTPSSSDRSFSHSGSVCMPGISLFPAWAPLFIVSAPIVLALCINFIEFGNYPWLGLASAWGDSSLRCCGFGCLLWIPIISLTQSTLNSLPKIWTMNCHWICLKLTLGICCCSAFGIVSIFTELNGYRHQNSDAIFSSLNYYNITPTPLPTFCFTLPISLIPGIFVGCGRHAVDVWVLDMRAFVKSQNNS